jgi:hypothetical protein
MAEQTETSKVVGFAEWILNATIWRVDRKELGGDNLTTVLEFRYSQLVVEVTTLISFPIERTYIALETF